MVRLVNEERERGRAGIREALELSRVETQAYINEQRQVILLSILLNISNK